jgi:hypothetical protein
VLAKGTVLLAPGMGVNINTLQFVTIDVTTTRAPPLSCIHGMDMQSGITGVDELCLRVGLQVDDCDPQ